MVKEIEINVMPEELENIDSLKEIVAKNVGIAKGEIEEFDIVKRSIDARRHPVNYRIKVVVSTEKYPEKEKVERYKDVRNAKPVIVVGAGPAGLFAALKLIEKGLRPIIIERGKPVSERKKDIALIATEQVINPDSNWCFGEGGAGTFSDGKLYTRSNKRGNVKDVLEVFVEHGVDKDIMIDAHAHIGTDRLSAVIKNIRNTIETYGGEYHFETRVVDFILEGDKIKGVITGSGDRIEADKVILATGHSARDIYTLFKSKNWAIEVKPFAMGVRIEHPQELINQIQYHNPRYSPLLPPATYTLAHNVGNRGVFSFCMCPGGIIVPAATDDNQLVVNGMSNSSRNSPYANSGIVVNVNPEDAIEFNQFEELSLMKFQESVERNMYYAAGKTQVAPAQRLTDFMRGKASSSLAPTSYLCGVMPTDMNRILPRFIASTLKKGFENFGNKMRGFLTAEANIIGVESRTSSPVRIPRNKEGYEHVQISGLYPCGEGAGYAGGITSSAIDGINVAETIAQNM